MRYATVTSVSPLQIAADGSSVAMDVAVNATGGHPLVGDRVLFEQITDTAQVAIFYDPRPVGEFMLWSIATPPDSSWLVCDGTAYGRTAADPNPQPRLYSVIGTVYGTGNGSTTFNVPNFTDRFPRGTHGNTGAAGGTDTHHHGLSGNGYARINPNGSNLYQDRTSVTWTANNQQTFAATLNSGSYAQSAAVALGGQTDDLTTLPPWLAIPFLIKAR